jgi:hypothetical protein
LSVAGEEGNVDTIPYDSDIAQYLHLGTTATETIEIIRKQSGKPNHCGIVSRSDARPPAAATKFVFFPLSPTVSDWVVILATSSDDVLQTTALTI